MTDKKHDYKHEHGQEESLLFFPEKFPIKIFGLDNPQLLDTVTGIINQYVEAKDVLDIHQNPSKNGKYVAVTITIMAQDKAQLDNIYQGLTDCPLVTMAL